MNLCDVNVWLALVLSGHVHHDDVRRWFDSTHDRESMVLCRVTQLALVRLLTDASVLAPYGNQPLTNAQAWRLYEQLARDDRVAVRTDEPAALERVWKQYAARHSASTKLWIDSYLVAFAVASGLRLVTTDVAFRQFDQLNALVLGNARDA